MATGVKLPPAGSSEMKLTPDGELDASLKVSIGKGGDFAGVAPFIRLLRAEDEQSRVLQGLEALELYSARVTPKR